MTALLHIIKVGPTLTFEAAFRDGECVDGADAAALAREMLLTMFEGRTARHPDAVSVGSGGQQWKRLDCNGREVAIRPRVRLAGCSLGERLERACAPVGADRARAFAAKEFGPE